MQRKPIVIIVILVSLLLTPYLASFSQSQADIVGSYVDTTYRIAPANNTGSLKTGQSADIMLSGIDFNNTGGSLLFNHLGECATDGQHLVVADKDNNRILIWNSAPGPNTPPDLVLGQKNFYSNAPGHGLDGLDWPVAVSIGGGKLVVADTYNNRILIWNAFPTRNDQPADLEIKDQGFTASNIYHTYSPLRSIIWPWGVWTNGNKLAISSTGGSYVLIWNTFPTINNQSADLYLTASGKFGTPRAITSDGNHLIVADHNAKEQNPDTSFVWNTFPTQNDQPFDYYISSFPGTSQGTGYVSGTILPDGQTILVGVQLYIFNSFPTNNKTVPNVMLGAFGPNSQVQAYLSAGAGSPCVIGSKLFVSLENPNKIVAYDNIPTTSTSEPDYAIGSPNPYTNTLVTHYFFTNPDPVTDGKHLFVASDFDNKLYVYRNIPDQSGAYPDVVYDFYNAGAFQPGAIALLGNTLALAGGKDVYIWNSLPLYGQAPDMHFSDKIGNVTFQNLQGVALDSQHFYLSDESAGKIYVWNGIPSNDTNPAFTLSTDQPARLSTDGKYLVVAATFSMVGSHVRVYSVSNLSSSSQPVNVGSGVFNLPESAIVANDHLFVADTSNNRVMIWNNITNALNNASPDTILGCSASAQTCYNDPEIGRNTLFWPSTLTFDGKYLWVGEFKFSGRLLRFSIGGPSGAPSVPRSELYDIQAGSHSFIANLSTNTTFSSMKFSDSAKTLSINTTSTTTAYVDATFPTNLLNGSLTVGVDGSPVVPQISNNATFTTVSLSVAPGIHQIVIVGTNAVLETTSTSITTATTASATCPSAQGSVTMVAIEPCTGTSGSLGTISGYGFAPNHLYQYCLQTGPPPSQGTAASPCPSNAPTFTTLGDGSIPSSPSVTLQIAGTPGQYTVVIRDPSNTPFVVWLSFVVSPSSTTSSTFTTSLSHSTNSSVVSETSTGAQTGSSIQTTSSLQYAGSSSSHQSSSASASEASNYLLYVGVGVAAAIVVTSSALILRRRSSS